MHLALSGEDGIRTHVPVKANGFQDRLVMTTSIPLLGLVFPLFYADPFLVSALNMITNKNNDVNNFLIKKQCYF